MTDRIKGYLITLDRDVREDDAERTLNAIRMIVGVATVAPMVTEPLDYMARARAKVDLFNKVVAAVLGAFENEEQTGAKALKDALEKGGFKP